MGKKTDMRTYLHAKRAQRRVSLQAQAAQAPLATAAALRGAAGKERGGVHGLEELVEVVPAQPAAREADALIVLTLFICA